MNLKKIITTSLLASVMIPFAQGHAQGKNIPPDLFDDFEVTQPNHTNLPPKAIAGRNHAVKAHLDLLWSDSSLTLNLYDDLIVTAVRDRLVNNVQGSTVWIGHIEDHDDSDVTFAIRGQAMSGTVRMGADLYEIRFTGNRTHVISKLDISKNPVHPDINLLTIESGGGNPVSNEETSNDIVAAGAETGTIVDLMVVYTPKARANAAGIDGIESKIVNAVAKTNQAYLNSQIDMQLNIVHMTEIAYTESGDMYRSLNDLYGKTDGKMDEVHNLRNTYGADQVVLVSADANWCGYAWIMTNPGSSFEKSAFSVVHDDSKYACLSGSQTLAHELGHNHGNVHDLDNSGFEGAYSYSYGYRSCVSGGIQTIMSYRCSGASLIPYFSNPNVFYGTEATGTTNSEDTARSMNNTKSIIAGWRSSGTQDTSTPNAPSKLVTTALSNSEIQLSWSDDANNETGFRLERSSDGTSWVEFASTGANTTGFTDSGLTTSTTYQFRARAYNSNGSSDYSNMSSATTQQLVCNTNAPSLTMTPTTQYAGVGESLTYNISLKNNDSSACALVTFTVMAQDGSSVGSFSLSPGSIATPTWNTTAPASDGTFVNTVTATATGHNTVTASSTLIVDSTAPTKPGNLTASVKRKSQVTVSWGASSDAVSGLKTYVVQRNGSTVATTGNTSFIDRPGSGSHTYVVLAQDFAGNNSLSSSVVVSISGSTKGGGGGKGRKK